MCSVQCAMCNVRVQASVQCAWVGGRETKAALEVAVKKVTLLTSAIGRSTSWSKRMVWAITIILCSILFYGVFMKFSMLSASAGVGLPATG